MPKAIYHIGNRVRVKAWPDGPFPTVVGVQLRPEKKLSCEWTDEALREHSGWFLPTEVEPLQ